MNHLLEALSRELQTRKLNVEYRGEPDKLHLVGETQYADEKVIAALKAAKRRLLDDVLIPAYRESNGQPVRLPEVQAKN